MIKAIKQLCRCTSAGMTNIAPELIQHMPHHLVEQILHWYQGMYNAGKIPVEGQSTKSIFLNLKSLIFLFRTEIL